MELEQFSKTSGLSQRTSKRQCLYSQTVQLTEVDGASVVVLDVGPAAAAAATAECLTGGRAFGCTFGTLRDVLRRSVDCCDESTAEFTVFH